jgi:two-component system response regulator
MGTPLKLIIVEDSEDDAMLLVRHLRRSGFDPAFELVATPEQMHSALDRETWDIVIADYSLPHFSGVAALGLLKERKIDIPFIIVSGVIGEETAVEAMKAGAHDYLMKGTLARLIPAVERELREAETRREGRLAEEALRESQRKLLTLMSNLPGMAYRSRNDRESTMEFVSDGCMDLTGYQPSDLIDNRRISYAQLIHPDDREQVWNLIQVAVKLKSPHHLLYRIKTAPGGIKWVWEKGRGVFSRDGQLLALEGFITDITERKEAEERLKASLKEKEVLLREIHHRVKNNLQIIFSLLNLQSGYIRDSHALDMFRECQNRVRSMALIHEVLYQAKDLARVNFAEYIKNLALNLFRSYGVSSEVISLNISVREVMLEIDTAIPCGLIINELVSNSLKYAFPGGKTGKITIDMHLEDGNQLILIVSDDGVGLPAGLDFRNTETLGLQLVNTLTDQLKGLIEVQGKQGTEFKIIFPPNGLMKGADYVGSTNIGS